MAVNNVTLNLAFEDQSYLSLGEFWVFKAVLTEALSHPYTCKIQILCKNGLPLDTLRLLLKSNACLSVSQDDSFAGTVQTRVVKGMIGSYKFLGSLGIKDNCNNACFAYELVLQPRLNLTALNCKSVTYSALPFSDLIAKILNGYGCTCDFGDEVKQLDVPFGGMLINQQEQSDFELIVYLMKLYGINFNFEHKDHDDQDGIGFGEKLYFSHSWQFNADDEERLSCSLLKGGQAVTLNSLNVEESLAPRLGDAERYEDDLKHNFDDSYFNYQANADYIKDGSGSYVSANQRTVNINLRSALNSRKRIIKGKSANLSLHPGRRLELLDLKSSEGDSGLRCVVSSVKLEAVSSVPADLYKPLKGELTNSITVSFEAVQEQTDDIPGCLLIESAADLRALFLRKGSVLIGRICEREGSVRNKTRELQVVLPGEDDSQRPSFAFVRLESGGNIIIADLLNPFGTGIDGLSRYPKLGERVLVGMGWGRFFIQGYLDDDDQNEKYSVKARKSYIGSSKWRHQAVNQVCNQSSERLGDGDTEIGHVGYDSSVDYVLDAIYKSRIERLVDLQALVLNDTEVKTIYSQQYQEKISSLLKEHDSLILKLSALNLERRSLYLQPDRSELTSGDNLIEQNISQCERQITAVHAALGDNCAKLADIAKELGDLLKLTNDYAAKTLALNSGGNLQLGSLGRINQACSNYSLSADNNITATTNDTVMINAGKKIVLNVGGSTIALDKNGITLRSLKWMTGTGPFDALIKLDSISGINMMGMSVAMKAVWGAILADSFGAIVNASNGNLDIKGASISATTNPKQALIANLTNFTTNLTMELSSLHNDAAAAKRSYAGATGEAASNMTLKTLGGVKQCMNSQHKVTSAINLILGVCISLIDVTVNAMLSVDDSVMSKPADKNESLSVRDAIMISSLCLKASLMLSTLQLSLRNSLFSKSSQLSLSAEDVKINAKKFKTVCADYEQSAAPGSGTVKG